VELLPRCARRDLSKARIPSRAKSNTALRLQTKRRQTPETLVNPKKSLYFFDIVVNNNVSNINGDGLSVVMIFRNKAESLIDTSMEGRTQHSFRNECDAPGSTTAIKDGNGN